MDFIRSRKRRLRLLFSLRTWWRRRRFQYLAHTDSAEFEQSLMKECRAETKIDTTLCSTTEEESVIPQLSFYLERQNSRLFPSAPFPDPFQDSVESMDSIIDCREPIESTEFFLMEHLEFLNQSTQAQEVELVYDTS
mmetsp:Transcript_27414/g.60344  ORF Transcript_27414/g.60344 Transcript_27414/m.60344 type:complete len:137 (+) Transcript_27414:48-458(+)